MGAYSDDEGEPATVSQQKNTGPVQLSKPNPSYLVFFLVAGLMTRLYRIDNPHHVVFDEVHFGKFASYYLRHEYFFDVHPPLGKLLIALSGWLVGYDGNYLFDSIGDDYLTAGTTGPVPYQVMRAGPAILGGLLVPIMYLTVIELGGNNVAASIAAFMLLFDNAQITQTRLILLDSYLIFFIAMSLYAYAKFRNQASRAFSGSWWMWLLITGCSLAGAVSVKLVGLFIIAVVGIHTVYDLWAMYSDLRVPLATVSKHFLARAVGLIAIPVALVMAGFWVHFAVLTNSGPGDTHMSNNFQAGLVGNSLHGSEINQPLDIAYGSVVTIKSVSAKPPCWLHSHRDRYPQYYDKGTTKQRVSSAQQQVTCYPHNDHNNEFMVLEADRQTRWHRRAEDVAGENARHQSRKEALLTAKAEQLKTEDGELRVDVADDYDVDEHAEIRYIKDGDTVKLLHVATNKLLNSHDVASAMNPSRQEVSGWDSTEKLAGQTEWRIKVKKNKGNGILPFKTRFQLEHVGTNTLLELSGDKLPEWGFKQAEVVSSKVPVGTHTTWFIDKHINDRLPSVQSDAIPTLSYTEKLFELINEMTEANARLTSKHVFASRPQDWPFLVRGISFYHGDNNQIYLIGNIMAWWFGHAVFFAFFAVFLFFFMREARHVFDLSARQHFALWNAMHMCVLAWVIHYVPFFFMERQLFLHHYLPAMLFVYATMGIFGEFLLSKLPRPVQIFAVSLGVFLTLTLFYLFAPMTYATPANGWEPALKWRRAWDFKGNFDA